MAAIATLTIATTSAAAAIVVAIVVIVVIVVATVDGQWVNDCDVVLKDAPGASGAVGDVAQQGARGRGLLQCAFVLTAPAVERLLRRVEPLALAVHRGPDLK